MVLRSLFSVNRKTGAGLVLAVLLLGAIGIWYFQVKPPAEDKLVLEKSTFSALPGWDEEEFAGVFPAFLKSCAKIATLPETRQMGGVGMAGTAGDWQPLCAAALALPPEPDMRRQFFEKNFTPFQIRNNDEKSGLFTGYYEASLNGSREKKPPYLTPLYLRPPELVMVDLGRFREELKGQRIAGKVVGGDLLPYPDRAGIEKGALADRELELVWVDSDIDAFFLHIQGSGLVEMDDGSELRVGYAAQNGHPYFAIGRDLIDKGYVPREEMSMQAIRTWLEENPDKATELMQKNASFVFFRELATGGPIGAQGVELTPERSLAVDRKWLPLGVPLWLATEVAPASSPAEIEKFERLMMAQDTGGAIVGPVRGDVFWGHGEYAYDMSGRMKSKGQLWIFLPNALAERINPDLLS
ncbi:murein transglycosylase A [Sneathiella sp. CAU 1612]|uniref:peptidoglycan lytic exotransglycosylase n=1 Tax=Sneathiella sedimenti TaxID=2816034 RepID=A0ABS3F331_9PROT|nr:murein transglycosylase A [Sneathiella sedimenti]MBO0332738.1 murein transglycosylase A [Sneathiella sedimenti]